jgi:putative addiction module killer protein
VGAVVVSRIDKCIRSITIVPSYEVKVLPDFTQWISSLTDGLTRRRLAARLRKASLGNLGDTKFVGSGVWEMREGFGPGWRMYYTLRGTNLIVMVGGGQKASQQSDIALAIERASFLEI